MTIDQMKKAQIENDLVSVQNKSRDLEQKYVQIHMDKNKILVSKLLSKNAILSDKLNQINGEAESKDLVIRNLNLELDNEKRMNKDLIKNYKIEKCIKEEFENVCSSEFIVKLEQLISSEFSSNRSILNEIKHLLLQNQEIGIEESKKKGNRKQTPVHDAQLKEIKHKIKELEKENSRLREEADKKESDISLKKKIRELEIENKELKNSTDKDTIVLLNNKILELNKRLEKQEHEISTRTNSVPPFIGNEVILPETTVIKNNPYDKSFSIPKKNTKKNSKSKLINVKNLIENSNKSYFNDLSFGASSPFGKKKSKN